VIDLLISIQNNSNQGDDVAKQMTALYALSLKQPWAALAVGGLKTIEVRRWPTARRGRVLIHAAGVPDEREEGWRRLPPHLDALAQMKGGLIGAVEVSDCRRYDALPGFLADQPLHLNEASWFQPPVLYGFVFVRPEVLPFRQYPGWFRFFPIQDPETAAPTAGG
jgi:hypothetical protein